MEVAFHLLGALGSIAAVLVAVLEVYRFLHERRSQSPAAMPVGDKPESRDEG